MYVLLQHLRVNNLLKTILLLKDMSNIQRMNWSWWIATNKIITINVTNYNNNLKLSFNMDDK